MPWDARLILGGQPADVFGQANTVADFFNKQQLAATQQAHEQRTLADLATQQRRGTALRDLLTQAGPAPQAQLAALQANPQFFPEAMNLESHIADVGAKKASEASAKASEANAIEQARSRGMDNMVRHFAGVVDDADYQRRLAKWPEASRQMMWKTWDEARPQIEGMAAQVASRPILTTDENGNRVWLNPKQPEAPGLPAMGPGGKQLKRPAPGGGGAAGGSPKEWKELANAINTGARGSLNKDLQKSINSAEGLETLLKLPDGSLMKASRQQMHEAYTSLNNLISKGGSQAASQIEALVPETLASKWSDMKQKILNEPQSADAEAFIENILDTTKRESTLARKQLRRQQLQSIPNYAHLRKADQTRFESVLKGVGIDPAGIDENGLEVAAPAEGGLPRVATNEDFRALPSGTEFLDPKGVRRRKP